MIKLFACLIFSCTALALQAQDLFTNAAANNGLRPEILKSIAEMESQSNPWAINLNWEGFLPTSKRQAITLVKQAESKPWLLKVEYGDQPQRMFFSSKADAEHALLDIQNGAEQLRLPRPDSWQIRLMDVTSVDIGMMQINWKFHGRHFESPEQLLDPKTNVEYAAKYLRKLINQHGNEQQAVAFYHSNTLAYQAQYLALFWPIYQKQLLAKR